MQLADECGITFVAMMPSQWRKIIGNLNQTKLNYRDRDQGKDAVKTLMRKLYPFLNDCSEDACEASGLGLAVYEWDKAFAAKLADVRTKNPKIRSVPRLEKLAEKATLVYFDKEV